MGLRADEICGEGGVVFADFAVHAHLFELHVEVEDLFEQVGGGLAVGGFVASGVLLADGVAGDAEEVFDALDGVAEGAIGVVEERSVGQAPLFFVFGSAGKAVGMELAAEAVELRLKAGKVDAESWLEAEDLEVIAARGRLDLAAMGAKECGIVVSDGTGPTGDGDRGVDDVEVG
jgi:hypothetical protein